MSAEADRQRVAIEGVEPEIDCGRFPIQRVVGERVVVEADLFAAGRACSAALDPPSSRVAPLVPRCAP